MSQGVIFPRKKVPSLYLLTQIQTLKIVHQAATKIHTSHNNWLKSWSPPCQAFVDTIDVKDMDTEAFLRKIIMKGQIAPKSTKPDFEQYLENIRQKQTVLDLGKPPQALVDYILFKKCKYITDLKAINRYLGARLSVIILNDLMATLHSMAAFNNSRLGVIPTQMTLVNSFTSDLRILSYDDIYKGTKITSVNNVLLHKMMLMCDKKLTHLVLGDRATDQLLKIVAKSTPNLILLDISNSKVSDCGLFYLCGYNEVRVMDLSKVHEDFKLGKLAHFKGIGLHALNKWPAEFSWWEKVERSPVRLEAGLANMLQYLPNIKSFETGVGGRVIQAMSQNYQRSGRSLKLGLEMMDENCISKPLLSIIKEACPNLTCLKANTELNPSDDPVTDSWISVIKECTNLKELIFHDSSLMSKNLSQILPDIGSNLTTLKLMEQTTFKYSNFQSIKVNCINLITLSIGMASECVYVSDTQISVVENIILDANGPEKSNFKKLQEFYLSGPFGYNLVRYLLKGANDLRNLTLAIEWPHTDYCDAEPMDSKDLIGPEYLQEILSVNKMEKLEQIRLIAQYVEGRDRLRKQFALMILEKFPKLRYIGDFDYWDMTYDDVRQIRDILRSYNRNVIFNLDAETAKFEYVCIENRGSFVCKDVVHIEEESFAMEDDDIDEEEEEMDQDDVSEEEDDVEEHVNNDGK